MCCKYDEYPWIGKISEEYDDFNVVFMHLNGPSNQFHWPSLVDIFFNKI